MSKDKLNLRSYYYSFDETGVLLIDSILAEVARAGKKYHHTDSWSDTDAVDGISCIEAIQGAANESAMQINKLQVRIEAFTDGDDEDSDKDSTVWDHPLGPFKNPSKAERLYYKALLDSLSAMQTRLLTLEGWYHSTEKKGVYKRYVPQTSTGDTK